MTLSRVKREMSAVVDSLVEQGKTREQATAEVEAKQGELIANIINEELILQKVKNSARMPMPTLRSTSGLSRL